ncbi:radical SAM protein [Candidatus Gottesmanbacteria bacterium]|nr:radical SAM protein [Candidatus Gottesmanbacteria bacterium]
MKPRIVIGYPPLPSFKGTPLLSQNRQFQYFHSPTYIYPMVPASSATLLSTHSYDVHWIDGIAENQSYDEWIQSLGVVNPDILMIETKSPVIKTHWEQIAHLKSLFPSLKIVLVGDHVSFLPLESFEKSKVDYVLTGGDYDFTIVDLANHIYRNKPLGGGVYWRNGNASLHTIPLNQHTLPTGEIIYSSGPPDLKHNLDTLPFIDRRLTKWELYAYHNGNYKYKPGTYMYSGRDCWWNRCTFCVWVHTLNPIRSYRTFSPERLFAEVKHVVDTFGVKEIFDDAGTLFIGPKLEKFCNLLIESGYNKKVRYGCNMRFNALRNQKQYDLMTKAGFRFILFGMESANQKTLDKLDKGIKEEDIINGAKMATKAGLDPHVTIMLGYPWETYKDAKYTIDMAKYCFKKGYFNTMQATIVIPYPGTPLWKECKEKNWLLTQDYNAYDMRKSVMKIPFSQKKLLNLIQELYSAFFSPQYIVRQILQIRTKEDILFLFSAGKKLLGHFVDFDPNQTKSYFAFDSWLQMGNKFISHLLKNKTVIERSHDKILLFDKKPVAS